MNILVVDDETDIKDLFQQRFRKEIRDGSIRLAFAGSGEEALTYLKDHDQEAVLILSDINMPGMTGLELLKQIKLRYVAPPPVVMMVTAYGDEENHKQAISLGADDFLTKPLDFTLLKEKLKTTVHG
jgi:two-component system chemotaxis response regulator CheY